MRKKQKNRDPKLNFDRQLDFHGYNGDDAVYELEEALYTYSGKSILIVHGKGTGILRQRIREFLSESKLPKSVKYGEEINLPGADGVTVVYT
jgi:DNA mismatch repair protein MutS2